MIIIVVLSGHKKSQNCDRHFLGKLIRERIRDISHHPRLQIVTTLASQSGAESVTINNGDGDVWSVIGNG
jgi:hypothetical protein